MHKNSIFWLLLSISAQNNTVPNKTKAQIDKWLVANKGRLNEYGDLPTTIYRSNVFYDAKTGKNLTKYEYIIARHPDAPWSSIPVQSNSSAKTKQHMNRWLRSQKLNIYGDPELTWYKQGENPLVMTIDGKKVKVTPEERVKLLFPHKPWKQNCKKK